MPAIITAPARTRTSSRGMTESQCVEYVEALDAAGNGEIVLVDESNGETYEKAYAKGERVRLALAKYELVPEGKGVKVIAFRQEEDGDFVAAVAWKTI